MKKIKNFNVMKMNEDRYHAWEKANPKAKWSERPVDIYDTVQIEAWLLSPKDLQVWGNYPIDEAQKLYDRGIKFVVHHSLGCIGDKMSDWWDASEYSTSGKLTRKAHEKRHHAIWEMCSVLLSYCDVLDKTLEKKRAEWGVVNQ